MIKPYHSIYENYNFDILTPDYTTTKLNRIELDNPMENDWEEPVDKIIIEDIDPSKIGLYLNLHRDFGGLPRLTRKGEFQETINTRFETSNGIRNVVYLSTQEDKGLIWIGGYVQEVYKEPSSSFSPYKCLCIRAKDLKIGEQIKAVQKDRLKQIRKMGKRKFVK
jgi:hypothetical protein